jgi:hypothetical protein
VLPYVAAGREHLVSFCRREHQPELRHGLAAERDRARGESPDLWEALASPVSCAYAPSVWVPPYTRASANVAAAPSTSPHRAVMPRRLDDMCRRLAKVRPSPHLGESCSLVEAWLESQPQTLVADELRLSRHPFGDYR